MSKTRVKVTMRDLPHNATPHEKYVAFQKLHNAFKKAVAEAGILHDYKKHEFYESKGEKRRRKKREADLQRLRSKLKENFPEKYSKKSDSSPSRKNYNE